MNANLSQFVAELEDLTYKYGLVVSGEEHKMYIESLNGDKHAQLISEHSKGLQYTFEELEVRCIAENEMQATTDFKTHVEDLCRATNFHLEAENGDNVTIYNINTRAYEDFIEPEHYYYNDYSNERSSIIKTTTVSESIKWFIYKLNENTKEYNRFISHNNTATEDVILLVDNNYVTVAKLRFNYDRNGIFTGYSNEAGTDIYKPTDPLIVCTIQALLTNVKRVFGFELYTEDSSSILIMDRYNEPIGRIQPTQAQAENKFDTAEKAIGCARLSKRTIKYDILDRYKLRLYTNTNAEIHIRDYNYNDYGSYDIID